MHYFLVSNFTASIHLDDKQMTTTEKPETRKKDKNGAIAESSGVTLLATSVLILFHLLLILNNCLREFEI